METTDYHRNLPLSDEEIALFRSRIKDIAKDSGIILSDIQNQTTEIVNKEYPNAKIAQNLSIRATATFRPESGDHIMGKNMEGIRIFFKEMKIELHRVQDCQNIQYRIWVSFDGKMNRTKSKAPDPLYTRCNFFHGDSIESIDYDDIRRNISDLFHMQNLTLSQKRALVNYWVERGCYKEKVFCQ